MTQSQYISSTRQQQQLIIRFLVLVQVQKQAARIDLPKLFLQVCVFSIQMNMLYTMFLRCNHKMFLFSLSLSLKRILDSSPVPVTADMKDSRKRSRVFLFVLFLFFCHTLRLESILKLSSQCVTEIISYPYLTYTTVSKNDSGWRRSQ